jgi:hypothetical protein
LRPIKLTCFINICCRKVREAPVDIEENKEDIEVKESYKTRKESKKEEARAEKYNKKDKIKQVGEEPYVTKDKKKPKELEGKAYKKTKSDERKPPKRQIVEEDVETETVESNKEESEVEESLSYSPRTFAEENELQVAEKYNKKDKIKQVGEQPYVTKEKRKPKELENKAYKKTKSDERKPPKRQIVEEDVETETVESNKKESEGEESLLYSPRTSAEENELQVATLPSKSCIIKHTVEEDILEDEPDILEDEETSDVENVPAKRCYYK